MKALLKGSNMSTHLVMNSWRFATYQALRKEVTEILMAQRALNGPAPLDIGALR